MSRFRCIEAEFHVQQRNNKISTRNQSIAAMVWRETPRVAPRRHVTNKKKYRANRLLITFGFL
jgi:hypothetical protein